MLVQGKTVVVIALILANKCSQGSALKPKMGATPAKTTLIVAPNTIIGQWHSELQKWAPSLNCRIWHSAFKAHNQFVWDTYDVVVSTPGCVPGLLNRNPVPQGGLWRTVVE